MRHAADPTVPRCPKALLLAATLAAGCGGGGQAPAPRPTDQPLAATPARRSEPDVVVAKVAGLPVYGSCVAAQALLHPGDEATRRRAGLDDCIAFELLAQEAARRRLGNLPEVQEARRQAAANRLVELEIDDKIRTAADLPEAFTARVLERNRWRLEREEYRSSFFVRFPVAKGEPAGGPADTAARVTAERVAAVLAPERGLFPEHVRERARALAGTQPMEDGQAELSDRARLVPAYSDALFAIPELGSTSPAIRTEWGWDVILWTKRLAPRRITREQLAEELFPELRQAYFVSWSKRIGGATKIEIFADALERTAKGAEP